MRHIFSISLSLFILSLSPLSLLSFLYAVVCSHVMLPTRKEDIERLQHMDLVIRRCPPLFPFFCTHNLHSRPHLDDVILLFPFICPSSQHTHLYSLSHNPTHDYPIHTHITIHLQTEKLVDLISRFGRNWIKIGSILGRYPDGCRDKWRSLQRMKGHHILGASVCPWLLLPHTFSHFLTFFHTHSFANSFPRSVV